MAPAGHSDSALLLDAALENIPYGFCVWSSEFKLVMWNRHYLDIYGFSADRIVKDMPLEDVVKLSAELGNHPGQTPAQFLAAYKKEHDPLLPRDRLRGARELLHARAGPCAPRLRQKAHHRGAGRKRLGAAAQPG